jgi:hypothetical protein
LLLVLAAGWAFAEAILFFIVADVPISWIAVRSGWRPATAAAFGAAFAAAAGGALLYTWASADPTGAARAVAALPGIDEAMIAETAARFAKDGYWAMLEGSVSGVPYKLYVLAAAGAGRPLLSFLMLSVLFRLPRFLGAALGAAALSRLLARRLSMRFRLGLLGGIWLAFYAFYFSVMPA